MGTLKNAFHLSGKVGFANEKDYPTEKGEGLADEFGVLNTYEKPDYKPSYKPSSYRKKEHSIVDHFGHVHYVSDNNPDYNHDKGYQPRNFGSEVKGGLDKVADYTVSHVERGMFKASEAINDVNDYINGHLARGVQAVEEGLKTVSDTVIRNVEQGALKVTEAADAKKPGTKFVQDSIAEERLRKYGDPSANIEQPADAQSLKGYGQFGG